jgi:hypothetical protein
VERHFNLYEINHLPVKLTRGRIYIEARPLNIIIECTMRDEEGGSMYQRIKEEIGYLYPCKAARKLANKDLGLN